MKQTCLCTDYENDMGLDCRQELHVHSSEGVCVSKHDNCMSLCRAPKETQQQVLAYSITKKALPWSGSQ